MIWASTLQLSRGPHDCKSDAGSYQRLGETCSLHLNRKRASHAWKDGMDTEVKRAGCSKSGEIGHLKSLPFSISLPFFLYLAYCSTLLMKPAASSETLLYIYQVTRHHTQGDFHSHDWLTSYQFHGDALCYVVQTT